jgi:hypothetical protein
MTDTFKGKIYRIGLYVFTRNTHKMVGKLQKSMKNTDCSLTAASKLRRSADIGDYLN